MDLTDEELATAAGRGDKAAVEVLVYRYHSSIYKYVYRLTGAEATVEDIVQDTFLHMIRALKRGDMPQRFKPWLYRIASNLCRDMWRSASYKHEDVRDDMSQIKDMTDSGNMADLMERQELRNKVVDAITALPMDIRQPVVLHFYEGLKIKEISATMDIPEGTVKSRLHKAYCSLKQQLAEYKGGAVDEQAR
ncbi:MAG: hypothetical protein PWQ93_814 [Clostridiales bacterium]|nr:hypothetical protein [Clostridiales bacterium]